MLIMFNQKFGYPRRKKGMVFVILYLVFAAYIINYGLKLVTIPTVIDPFNKWIFLIGGILLAFGAINHLRLKKYTY